MEKYKFLYVLKHLMLFASTSVLAATILCIPSELAPNFPNILMLAGAIMLFNAIPYAILLLTIKWKKWTSLGWYIVAGMVCPVVPLILSLGLYELLDNPMGMIAFIGILLVGALCGLFYGVLDKKIQVGHKDMPWNNRI